MTPGRRSLRYDSLDQVMPDVERLLQGHTKAGNWSLAEICRHLAKSMRLAVDMPASTKHDPSLQFSAKIVAQIFETGLLPEGLPQPAVLAAPQPIEEREAAELLREAIAYYATSTGPVAGHRFLGPLSKTQWDHLQRIHCAHHLSFATPIAG